MIPKVRPRYCVRSQMRATERTIIANSAAKDQSGIYGESCISILSARAAWILCGSNKPTGLANCGNIPPLSVPTIAYFPATAISCRSVCGVSTHEIHFLPKLSVLTGGIPLMEISSMPRSFVFIMYVLTSNRAL